jgi:5'-nucleotidase
MITDGLSWYQVWHFGLDVAGKLIISPNKGLLKGDFLIDDMVNGRGQENFEGEIIHFGTDKYLTWKNVIDRFMYDQK